ncbi:hypothetical protein [Sulfurospirillum barnesii]|uniref:Uncharacterized protein n=1 Tax=Sulfurospirillum barnesii (strain ATCC 700032 / DSM 10660 / SES-3) TaxID=760154 RepID=I3XWE9_SULBS|nr:hypothetical protein [Sulfurospirillum barnesii]AFL68273.1 hypothetical protein Sulba_0972 [Sulfurospirillum barnesii SES-3]
MPVFLTGFFIAITEFLLKLFGKNGAKIAFFTVYTTLLVTVMNGVSQFAFNHFDTNDFMTPTICWFFTQLGAFNILGAYISFISANWLKRKMVHFWTYGN